MPKRPASDAKGASGAPPLQSNVADLRALAHPLRLRMLELFAETPRTTKQVAALLGQPPTRLYHHVAALERAGLLVLKETRPNRGVVEKWYEAVARQMAAPRAGARPGRAGAGVRRALVMTLLEQARQEMMFATSRPGAEAPLLVRLVVAAPPRTMPAVRERLLAMVKEIQQEFACDDADAEAATEYERWALTIAFAPVASIAQPAAAGKGRRRKR